MLLDGGRYERSGSWSHLQRKDDDSGFEVTRTGPIFVWVQSNP